MMDSELSDLELLKAMRALVASGWTQRALARDVANHSVLSFSSVAVRWCLVGAYSHLYHTYFVTENALVMMYKKLGLQRIGELTRWNDTPGRKKSQVLAVIDECIAELENV